MEHTGMNLVQTSNMQRAAAVEVTEAMAGLDNIQTNTTTQVPHLADCSGAVTEEQIQHIPLVDRKPVHFMVQAVAGVPGVTLASKMGLMAIRVLSTSESR